MQLQFILWLFLAALSSCADFSGWADQEGGQWPSTDAAIEKGKERYKDMEEKIKEGNEDVPPMAWCDITKAYSPNRKGDLNAGAISSRLANFIKATDFGINVDDKSWEKIIELYPDSRATPGDDDTAYYENAYSAKYNAIAVVDINRNSRESKDVTTITWASWLKVCEDAGTNPGGLKHLIHYTCRNENAEHLAEDIFGEDAGDEVTYNFKPGNDEKNQPFYALLGLDNGTGAKNMPISYQKTLGYKTLESITAWRDEGDTNCMGVAYHLG